MRKFNIYIKDRIDTMKKENDNINEEEKFDMIDKIFSTIFIVFILAWLVVGSIVSLIICFSY